MHDHLLQTRNARLALGHDPGLETAVAIARNLQIERTRLAPGRLRVATVTRIAAAATRWIVRWISEVMVHLRLERALTYGLEQAPLTEYILRIPAEVLE